MGVEARSENVAQGWPESGTLINGGYPLLNMLHGSDRSAVFTTEVRARGVAVGAIKLVRAAPVLTDLQLRHWRTATARSHPHLLQLFDSGQCQLAGQPYLFVVMEYADQTLAQLLGKRALTADEAREMLPPALDALAFLHRKNLVQGQLKPANFMVVGDQLKLASDTVRPAGEPRASRVPASLYDPPEAQHGRATPAGDIWGLGVTLVEALTQSLPWPDVTSRSTSLPPSLPPAFVDVVQRCLSHEPTARPTVAELNAEFLRAPAAPVVPMAQPTARETPPAIPQQSLRVRRGGAGLTAAAVAVTALFVLGWAALRAFHGQAGAPPAPDVASVAGPQPATPVAGSLGAPQHAATTPQPAAPGARGSAKASKPPAARIAARAPALSPELPADAVPSVRHAHIPAISRSALNTIRGRIKIGVLVMVDGQGNVFDALLENPGPSSYFARQARDAAKQWKFVPASEQDSRQWLLGFEFTRAGATVHATPRS
jgi:Protein kinase domain